VQPQRLRFDDSDRVGYGCAVGHAEGVLPKSCVVWRQL